MPGSTDGRYASIEEIGKFNPYHDDLGRFASSDGYSSFTIRTRDPGKQHMADMAIAREKERAAARDKVFGGGEEKKPASGEKTGEKTQTTFTPAKTKKEAVEYAQNELGFDKASYGTKLDIDTINHINEQITQIQNQYPEAKGACQVLKTTTAGVYAQIRTNADGSMNFEIGTGAYGRGMDAVNKSYAQDVEVGFHPVGTTAGSIVWHEYGHVLATVSAKQQYGATATGKLTSYDSQRNFINSRRSKATEKAWLFDAAKETGSKPSQIMSDISRYAQKNPAETFAEAFAEVNCSANPRASSVAVVKASGWQR